MTTTETWKAYCDATTDAVRDAYCERTYGAAHTDPPPTPDLIDFCFGLGGIELEVSQLARLLHYAASCGAQRTPTLRAHLVDLRHMQAELAALVSEAEAA